MKTITIQDRKSLEQVAAAMKARERFVVVTDDPNFQPLGHDRHSAEVWIGAAGGGTLMTVGAGALVLAFLDPEPTSKLGLLVAGGVIMTLTGGAVIITILVTRAKYTTVMRVDKETGKYEWILEPRG